MVAVSPVTDSRSKLQRGQRIWLVHQEETQSSWYTCLQGRQTRFSPSSYSPRQRECRTNRLGCADGISLVGRRKSNQPWMTWTYRKSSIFLSNQNHPFMQQHNSCSIVRAICNEIGNLVIEVFGDAMGVCASVIVYHGISFIVTKSGLHKRDWIVLRPPQSLSFCPFEWCYRPQVNSYLLVEAWGPLMVMMLVQHSSWNIVLSI